MYLCLLRTNNKTNEYEENASNYDNDCNIDEL